MDFHYQKDSRLSLEKPLSIEWLETNGLGGYASSTLLNCHTRKYHGLLVSKINHLPDKYVLLSKIEDIFIQNDNENFLTSHLYPGFFQEGSFSNLQEFIIKTHPVWKFNFFKTVVTKEILMPQGEDAVLFKYTVDGDANSNLILRPLFACRNFHKLRHEHGSLEHTFDGLSDGFSCMSHEGLPQLFFQTNVKHSFISEPLWYRNFLYPKERERGYDFIEDLFSPGVLIFEVSSKQEIFFSCSTEQQQGDLSFKWAKEIERRSKNYAVIKANEFQRQLHKASEAFITKNLEDKNSESIVAGYHWFLSWGRDAMISLPGLTLYSGKEDLCFSVLKTFASYEKEGLIPNILGIDKDNSLYNTVDASLWFAWAVQQYYIKTKNLNDVMKSFWPTIKNIFKFYTAGTLYNIKMDKNGLLFAGGPDINLTWMDAMVDGKPVTPRYGYQVEINALWFNMLSFMSELTDKNNDPINQELKKMVGQIKKSFCETFYCKEKDYLYDFVNDEQKNSALRPNQIFAVSLPYSPLSIKTAVSIMIAVRENLLTPYGLRTLAQYEPGYIGFYGGSQDKRDYAYHNGTVWPWLLGHFTEALLKVTSDKLKVLKLISPCLEALQRHMSEYGIGSIAEIFSGNYPHKPDGCISQAWSVAEVLRLTYLLAVNK